MNRGRHNRGGRLTLLLLVLLFALPPLAGWLFYANPQWLPERQKNHGILISPPRSLSDLALRDSEDAPFDWNSLKGHWTLVYHNRGSCGSGCQEQLERLRQIRRALGAERLHIERLLIQDRNEHDNTPEATRHAAGARLLYLDASQREQFERLFALPDGSRNPATYLIDPNGMLMMAHGEKQPAKEILQDLELLLKASRNWLKGVNDGYG